MRVYKKITARRRLFIVGNGKGFVAVPFYGNELGIVIGKLGLAVAEQFAFPLSANGSQFLLDVKGVCEFGQDVECVESVGGIGEDNGEHRMYPLSDWRFALNLIIVYHIPYEKSN